MLTCFRKNHVKTDAFRLTTTRPVCSGPVAHKARERPVLNLEHVLLCPPTGTRTSLGPSPIDPPPRNSASRADLPDLRAEDQPRCAAERSAADRAAEVRSQSSQSALAGRVDDWVRRPSVGSSATFALMRWASLSLVALFPVGSRFSFHASPVAAGGGGWWWSSSYRSSSSTHHTTTDSQASKSRPFPCLSSCRRGRT